MFRYHLTLTLVCLFLGWTRPPELELFYVIAALMNLIVAFVWRVDSEKGLS